MLKELEERKTRPNINLNFNSFCERTKKEEWEQKIELGYIAIQKNSILKTGKRLPVEIARQMSEQFWKDYKEAGFLDILNRIKEV